MIPHYDHRKLCKKTSVITCEKRGGYLCFAHGFATGSAWVRHGFGKLPGGMLTQTVSEARFV